MIYGSSNHPVEIKKIRLKVWTLRDELEYMIQQKVDAHGESTSEVNLAEIKLMYQGLIKLPPSFTGGEASMSTNDSLDDSEDEMAKALAEAEAGESGEESAEGETEESEGDDDAEAMAAAMLEGQGEEETPSESVDLSNVTFLRRTRPNIDEEKIADAVTILNDVNMNMVSCFASQEYNSGQTIIIEFLIPNHFFLTAEVIECKKYNISSRIISDQRPDYRLHAKLIFPREGERSMLRRFLKSIEPDIPPDKPKKAAPKDDDGLDDLDDLGF